MTADDIVASLRLRHADAVFVPECKDGPTQTRAHRRLDAWVLLRTWSPVTTIGYEIKVDRGDWLRDAKLADYQGLCHLLYVVAPKGIVKREELPAGVGLMEPVGDGARLVTRRRASRHEIDVPVSLLIYVLMSRAKIDADPRQPGDPHWHEKVLREWVAGKSDRQELSIAVGRKIREAFDAQERRLRELHDKVTCLESTRQRIVELGHDPDRAISQWRVRESLDQIAAVVPMHVIRQIESTEQTLARVRHDLEALREAGAGEGGG